MFRARQEPRENHAERRLPMAAKSGHARRQGPAAHRVRPRRAGERGRGGRVPCVTGCTARKAGTYRFPATCKANRREAGIWDGSRRTSHRNATEQPPVGTSESSRRGNRRFAAGGYRGWTSGSSRPGTGIGVDDSYTQPASRREKPDPRRVTRPWRRAPRSPALPHDTENTPRPRRQARQTGAAVSQTCILARRNTGKMARGCRRGQRSGHRRTPPRPHAAGGLPRVTILLRQIEAALPAITRRRSQTLHPSQLKPGTATRSPRETANATEPMPP